MAGMTTGKLPYPTGTDYLVDGDDSVKNLAEAVTTMKGPQRVVMYAQVSTTGGDGRIWVTLAGLTQISAAFAAVPGVNRWEARAYQYQQPNLVLIEVYTSDTGAPVASQSVGLIVFAWGTA